MTLPPPIAPLARLLGRDEFLARVGRVALPLAVGEREALRALIDERFDRLVDGLVEETAASDDVHDAASAESFAADRLRDLSPYLSEEQLQRLRERLDARIAAWR